MRSRTSMPGIYSSLHNIIVHFPMCQTVCRDQENLMNQNMITKLIMYTTHTFQSRYLYSTQENIDRSSTTAKGDVVCRMSLWRKLDSIDMISTLKAFK